jgi:hypothetical protein
VPGPERVRAALELGDSALQTDRGRMRAVLRPELGDDIRNALSHGVLGKRKVRTNLLVRFVGRQRAASPGFRA